MVSIVLANLEINFWKTAIPLMRQSQFIQGCLRETFRILKHREVLAIGALVVALGSLGLVLGLAAGILVGL
jgi:hypothetical protein